MKKINRQRRSPSIIPAQPAGKSCGPAIFVSFANPGLRFLDQFSNRMK
jgi:hypothetical protein